MNFCYIVEFFSEELQGQEQAFLFISNYHNPVFLVHSSLLLFYDDLSSIFYLVINISICMLYFVIIYS